MRAVEATRYGWGLLGFFLWMAAQALAFGLGGGGHGWVAPFFLSLPLLIIYPNVLIGAFEGGWAATPNWMVISSATGDVLLILSLAVESRYVVSVWAHTPVLFVAWLALWAAWQVLAFIPTARGRQGV